MSAADRISQAQRSGMPSKGLSHPWRTCRCHDRAWGLKKGLRRARRRVSKEVIREELTQA